MKRYDATVRAADMSNPDVGLYKLNGKLFRYNFTDCTVEYVQKADAETIASETDWMEHHNGDSLYGINTGGYIVLDTVGLRRENWEDREARKEYLTEWCAELDAELKSMMADFVRHELPTLL